MKPIPSLSLRMLFGPSAKTTALAPAFMPLESRCHKEFLFSTFIISAAGKKEHSLAAFSESALSNACLLMLTEGEFIFPIMPFLPLTIIPLISLSTTEPSRPRESKVALSMPPAHTFPFPANSAFSNKATSHPASPSLRATVEPAGPAPMTAASNFMHNPLLF